MARKPFIYHPAGWQLDPATLCHTATGSIGYWRNGLFAGSLTLDNARSLVSAGSAFCISDSAIGAMADGISLA